MIANLIWSYGERRLATLAARLVDGIAMRVVVCLLGQWWQNRRVYWMIEDVSHDGPMAPLDTATSDVVSGNYIKLKHAKKVRFLVGS